MSYLIRVDDRLVHGQVVEGWIKPLKISLIVICSDTVACDLMQQTLFTMSVPPYVKLECETIENTAINVVGKKYENENVLILVSSLKELSLLVNKIFSISGNFPINEINIGGVRHCGNKKQVYQALCLDKEDVDILKDIISKNVVLNYYPLPEDTKVNLNSVIGKVENEVLQGDKK